MDEEHRAVAIDIRHLKLRPLHEAEPAGVDRGEAGAIDGEVNGGQDAPHFRAAQDDGQFLLALRARDVEHGPRAAERLLVEALDAAQRDGVRAPCDLLHGAEVEEIVSHLLFRELVGGGMIEPGELNDGAGVGLDGAVGVAAELEIVDQALAERGHGGLSGKGERQYVTSRRQPINSPGGRMGRRNRRAIRRRRIEFNNTLQRTSELLSARFARSISLRCS